MFHIYLGRKDKQLKSKKFLDSRLTQFVLQTCVDPVIEFFDFLDFWELGNLTLVTKGPS